MKILEYLRTKFIKWKAVRAKKRRLKEMRKRDPFIY